MRSTRTFVLIAAVAVVFATGCAHRIHVYTASDNGTAVLVGKSVAVLPPQSVGAGQGTAIVGSRVMEKIFESEIAGVRFLPPRETITALAANAVRHAELRQHLMAALPVRIASRGEINWIFDGRTVGETRLPRKVLVSIRRSREPAVALAPELVPSDTFSGIEADYVLVSMTFSAYRQVSQITTLLGVLPFFWSQDLGAERPRSLFALYETKSGKRVWESVVAIRGDSFHHDKPYAYEVIDSRAMPFVAVAYLLTGDLESPLARAIRALDRP